MGQLSAEIADPSAPGAVAEEFRGLLVILPTRNRAELSIRAIRSVLSAGLADVRVLVSDNSTDEAEVERLRTFCRDLGESCVRYIRPPEPLAMSPHWEWAFEHALADDPANHFAVLGDRRIFRKGCLAEVVALTKAHPDSLVVYRQIMVEDHQKIISVTQQPWSGSLLRIDARDMLKANASGVWHEVVPVLQNCVVTRGSLMRVRERFGNRFLSTSPDYVFGFRALSLGEPVLIYDKPVILGSALDRSNGRSLARGVRTRDTVDFIATNPQIQHGFFATPIPEIMISTNAAFHEYNFVKAETKDGVLEEIQLRPYLATLAGEIRFCVEDPELKQHYYDLLAERGYQLTTGDAASAAKPDQKKPYRRGVAETLLGRSPLRGFWHVVHYQLKWPVPAWARWLVNSFKSTEEAIGFLNRFQDKTPDGSTYLQTSVPPGLFVESPLHPVEGRPN